jgi:hypothetical protein
MKRIHLTVFGIICSVMLILSSYSYHDFYAFSPSRDYPWSDGYYRLLRIVVCLVSGFFAYIAYSTKKQWILWPCLAMLIIYNPLLIIKFSNDTCILIDFIFGLFFLITAFVLRIPDELKPPK